MLQLHEAILLANTTNQKAAVATELDISYLDRYYLLTMLQEASQDQPEWIGGCSSQF